MKVKKVNFERFEFVPSCFKGKKYGYALASLSRRDSEKSGFYIPGKVNFIAKNFLNKLQLEEQPHTFDIPSQIIYIEGEAFRNSAVENVIMNWSGVKEVGQFCFAESKIKHLVLSDEISFIPIGMCFACKNLESITIPDSVTTISRDAFSRCSNLKTVVLGQGLKTIEEFAFEKTALEQVDIPASVKILERGAFEGCSNLKKVVLHEGLEQISSRVFKGTAIEEIEIPKSVKSLDLKAFADCPNLTKISFAGFNPELRVDMYVNEYHFNRETWLTLLTYMPTCVGWIPVKNFKDEKFIADCRDAIVKGMKARDQHFGLTEERISENMCLLNWANQEIDRVTGKKEESLQVRSQQLFQNFKAGNTTPQIKDK